jgi:hypothetical protein
MVKNRRAGLSEASLSQRTGRTLPILYGHARGLIEDTFSTGVRIGESQLAVSVRPPESDQYRAGSRPQQR